MSVICARPDFESAVASRVRVLFLLACVSLVLFLQSGTAGAEQLKRRVLAVYDGTVESAPDATLIHAWAEMPLNHMGYIVDYQDVAKGLPDAQSVSRYAAIMTWFTYDVSRPVEYLTWARRAADAQVPFMIFGSPGVLGTEQNLASFNRLLQPMGIAYTSNFIEATSGTRVLWSNPSIIGFERKLEAQLPSYPVIRKLGPDAQIALEVEAPARELRVHSALVAAGRGGAFVPGNFAFSVDPSLGVSQWIVDPFAIFGKVLRSGLAPVPDTTTVSGRRLYFSHVDGDGWNDSVEMDRYGNLPVLAAEVLARELVEPYPDLPVTVGLIANDANLAFENGEQAAASARRIYAQPQVEVASHSATAPLIWSRYEFEGRAEEERGLTGAPAASGAATWLRGLTDAFGVTRPLPDIDRQRALQISASQDRPRVYLDEPFSLFNEIDAAARKTSEFAPPGKRTRLYTWTGDARPFEEAVRATRLAGLGNMNGGGARNDAAHPSLSNVTPIARPVGDERQIYAVDAADSAYMSGSSEGFGGFGRLRETLDATETPRRLKGANLYYHVYSAKRQDSLNAVKRHLEWARKARLTPIAASEYASIADGFFTAKVEHTGPLQWTVSGRGGLQTMRLDDASSLSVNVGSSSGVLGSTVYQGALYVALDAAVSEAEISLQEKNEKTKDQGEAMPVQLEQASWQVQDMNRSSCGFNFTAHGFGTGQFEWKNLAPGSYVIEAKGNSLTWATAANSDESGRLTFEAPSAGIEPLSFKVSCAPISSARPM